jgi:hypothetical protein
MLAGVKVSAHWDGALSLPSPEFEARYIALLGHTLQLSGSNNFRQ